MDLSGQPHTQEQNLRIEQLSAVIEENYLHFRRSKRMKFPVRAWSWLFSWTCFGL